MTKLQIAAPITMVALNASLIMAYPTTVDAFILGRAQQSSDPYATFFLTQTLQVSPSEIIQLQPLDVTWGAPVNVSYTVTTVDTTRTVTLIYEAIDGEPFVTDDASVFQGQYDEYDIVFGVGFEDPEWDHNSRNQYIHFSGDGVTMIEIDNPTVTKTLTAYASGFTGHVSPGSPNFTSHGVVADRYEYSIRYEIVPEPAICGVALCVLLLARRRLGTSVYLQ